mgnify:CR=1 FL=1
MALLDKEIGNVGAADHFRVGGQRECAFICAGDAFFLQFGGDGFKTFQTALAHGGEQVLQRGVVFVEIKADDVDGVAVPRYRDFHAADKAQTERGGFGAGFGEAAGVVVVGEREQGAAVLMGEEHDFGGA